jgi:hypothetical protein
VIRPARPGDEAAIYQLICDLASYEHALPEVTGSQDDLQQALFGPQPPAFAHVAEHQGQIAGFALWFRGHGYGRALLAELAALCVERGYGRLEWSVLDWNAPAIGFYQSLDAVAMDEWTVHRLTGAALQALAESRDVPPG